MLCIFLMWDKHITTMNINSNSEICRRAWDGQLIGAMEFTILYIFTYTMLYMLLVWHKGDSFIWTLRWIFPLSIKINSTQKKYVLFQHPTSLVHLNNIYEIKRCQLLNTRNTVQPISILICLLMSLLHRKLFQTLVSIHSYCFDCNSSVSHLQLLYFQFQCHIRNQGSPRQICIHICITTKYAYTRCGIQFWEWSNCLNIWEVIQIKERMWNYSTNIHWACWYYYET